MCVHYKTTSRQFVRNYYTTAEDVRHPQSIRRLKLIVINIPMYYMHYKWPVARGRWISSYSTVLLMLLCTLGPAFTVIYVVAGLPLARLADTRSRSVVLVFGLTFWSMMVLLTGFAQTFWQLMLLRVLLGIGEVSVSGLMHMWQSQVE